ncbi:MAG TPA: EamA family transporter [Lysobacter sp.]|nr:EamA family transporter [Lysobacter sp.]
MERPWLPQAAVGFCVVVLVIGQLLFKQVAINYNARQTFQDWSVAGTLAVALALYGISTLVWIWALRYVQISRAYPAFALGFALVPLVGAWWFDEKVSTRLLVGLALIIGGVIVTARS